MLLSKYNKRIVVIGGGTGTYSILSGLKKYKELDLSVIVTMMDSGGSNRILRDEFGILPTSDIRQCIVALSSEDSDQTLRKLFTYRYNQGIGISGMTFGNLFMAALTDIYQGDQEKAIEETCEILGVRGHILPITFDNTNLVARYSNGRQVLGEHHIDEPDGKCMGEKIVDVELFPKATANKKALEAIKQADIIIFGPGGLYTSILPNILVSGVKNAIKRSRAKKVYVVNLMIRHGQTDGYSAKDHLRELEKYLGSGTIDCCLINKSNCFPKGVLKRYKEEGASPVIDDFNSDKTPLIIRGDFVSQTVYHKDKSDSLSRSLVRHDPDKLAKVVVSLL